ncbi:hypothetical protein Efla_000423 [Eimeria flavescens]
MPVKVLSETGESLPCGSSKMPLDPLLDAHPAAGLKAHCLLSAGDAPPDVKTARERRLQFAQLHAASPPEVLAKDLVAPADSEAEWLPSGGVQLDCLGDCVDGEDLTQMHPGVNGLLREDLNDQRDASSTLTQRPSADATSSTRKTPTYSVSGRCIQKPFEKVSRFADRVLVLLWRVFTLKARHPVATLIGILAPLAVVVSACAILVRYHRNPVQFVPSNTSEGDFLRCNFGAYRNLAKNLPPAYNPCSFTTSLMPIFGRHYDGLRLMYLPAILYYGGYLGFVDTSGTDCQQLRRFMENYVKTISPYLMRRTKESELFVTFSSEKELDKYRRNAAANSKRPVYAAFICRASGPGQLDITIRMHTRRATPRTFINDTIKNRMRFYSGYDSTTYFNGGPYLLAADVIGTPAENKAYGHHSGGFLDLLTLAHTFNLNRTGVRRLPADSPVPKTLQPQWFRISELYFKTYEYFGRIPVLDSVAFTSNSAKVMAGLIEEAEQNLAEVFSLISCISASLDGRYLNRRALLAALRLPAWLLGPSVTIIQLFTERSVAAGCDVGSPAMQLLKLAFYSRTKGMGVGVLMAVTLPLHTVLQAFSTPVRKAYAPINLMESGMPHAPARTISHPSKPHSCSAPFVVLMVCILWQVVKAIMVDKETGFKNMLKIMGVPDRALWLSWYLFFILFNLPLILLVTYASNSLAFTLSSFWMVLLLFLLALLATISFAVFITALFNEGNLAAMAGCAWYILIWVPVVCQRYGTSAWSPHLQRTFMILCPGTAFGVGLDIAWLLNEPCIGGLHTHTLNFPVLGISVKDTFAALVISSVLFTLLGAYLHKVLPRLDVSSDFGRGRPSALETPHGHQKARIIQTGMMMVLVLKRHEIFGLLGQNGAGKTTLISILTGSLAATHGDVMIGGVSVREHPGHARRNIGYCPQYDVLLPYLTIEETLWLYASLRGVPKNRRREDVGCLMQKMKLSEMAGVRVSQLSGGWRRRVSSSVAFLGEPLAVFLDEPTAGMDIVYRRTFWDSVRGLSKGRSIILITHMMEEADYLCDRLGVMAGGSIVCLGPALSLKTRFGSGYTISVMTQRQDERSEREAAQRIQLFLQSLEHPLAAQKVSRNELKVICPFSCTPQLPLLFSELEDRGHHYGVDRVVLGYASLEEVFLNVTRLAIQGDASGGLKLRSASDAGESKRSERSRLPSLVEGCAEAVSPEAVELRQICGGFLCSCASSDWHKTLDAKSAFHKLPSPANVVELPAQTEALAAVPSLLRDAAPITLTDDNLSLRGSALLASYKPGNSSKRKIIMQTRVVHALIVKRIRLVYRDWALLTISFIIPLLLMGLTLYLRMNKSEPRVPLTGRQFFEYGLPASVHPQVPYGGTGWMLRALDRCHSPFMTHDNVSREVRTNGQMYTFLLKGYFGPHPPRYGGYVVHGSEADLSEANEQLDVTLWHNSTFRDSVPLYYNHLLNCLAEDHTAVEDAVLASNQPFEDNDDKFLDGIVVAFFTVIAFSFVAAGVGQICIEERIRKVRHQQILAGVTPFQYWLSAYLVDFVLLIIPCSFIYGLLVWTDISPLVGPHQRPAFILSMILFCLSVCPLGYALSAGVDSPMTFVIVMLLLGWSLPSIQALFTEVSGPQGMYANLLRYIFMLLPHAAVCELLTNLVTMNQVTSGTMKAIELVDWMNFSKIGCPLVYLSGTVVLNWFICLAIDCKINYPMNSFSVKSFFKLAVNQLRRSSHLPSSWVWRVQRGWLTRNPSAGSSAGAPSTAATPNQTEFKQLHLCREAGTLLDCKPADAIGLHVQDEEATAVEAVCRLRQRRLNARLPSLPQKQLQGSCAQADPRGAPSNSSASNSELRVAAVFPAGVNGSGKSTTFSILGSLMCQSGGTVFVDGRDARTEAKKTRAKLRYCPQTDALLPTLTGAEHVYFYGCLLGLAGGPLVQFCSEFFEVIGCSQYMHRPVRSYSGGTKRKLSLGLAMIGSVDLLLLDEPTNGVDPESRQLLWRMIENAKSCKIASKAILLTSHSLEECEVLSDRVGVLHRGKLLCLGTPTELRSTYGHGYQIECIFVSAAVARDPQLPRRFISTLLAKLPSLLVVHLMAYKVTASISKEDTSLGAIFCEIEAVKASEASSLAVEAYAVSETTLEEVFIEVNNLAERSHQE